MAKKYISTLAYGGVDYIIKDAEARDLIADLGKGGGAMRIIGITGDELEDLSNKESITIKDSIGDVVYDIHIPTDKETPVRKTLKNGYVVLYNDDSSEKKVSEEYVAIVHNEGTDEATITWHLFGTTSAFGTLAFKNGVSVAESGSGHNHSFSANGTISGISGNITGTTAGSTKKQLHGKVTSYSQGIITKKKLVATASGTQLNSVTKYVVSDGTKLGSVTGGVPAEVNTGDFDTLRSGGYSAFPIVEYNEQEECLSFLAVGFKTNTPTAVTLPTFSTQTIATSVKANPSISLAESSESGFEVVTGVGSLGTNASGGNVKLTLDDAADTNSAEVAVDAEITAQGSIVGGSGTISMSGTTDNKKVSLNVSYS